MGNPHHFEPAGSILYDKAQELGHEFLLGRIGRLTYDLPQRSLPGQSHNALASVIASEASLDIKLEKAWEGPDPLHGAGTTQVTEVRIGRDPKNPRNIKEIDAARYYFSNSHKSANVAAFSLKRVAGEANQISQSGNMGLWVVTRCIGKAVRISSR